MLYKANIIIEKDEDGYCAYCPELPGCQSQGDSLEEVRENIFEAVELYLETLSESEKQALVNSKIVNVMFNNVATKTLQQKRDRLQLHPM
ncbi:type II toxin-antitoxin system HicB family antitoxin [Plectonema radiosum NIES-515]|uniref:Type II toxin-antitoxin system HicB family antitoxin n=1 Tax=Plectonema radiosum NIES-515 TaxID=2986073 RepID=A0ABT3B726_9CYAN|nr:type II toxin-antitoxin system HicB family antitoxin [Plectonema radiosum]MCV3217187.1 type II toxin-antitoxin system HicB family antitoxin [Plectonema radiosum NIES-515]